MGDLSDVERFVAVMLLTGLLGMLLVAWIWR
jgi:hypothetical protein